MNSILWYLRRERGPHRIGYDVGWGQSVMQSLSEGLVLFYWTPDWRSYWFQFHAAKNKGKMGLIPLPAWKKGGRRTSIWGGAGISIAKRAKDPELAWKLAKFLYFDPAELGSRFEGTNILPPLKEVWDLPEFRKKNAYYGGQRIGRDYAALAPSTPAQYSSPVDQLARSRLDETYTRCAEYYERNGERGLADKVREEVKVAAHDVKKLARRSEILEKAK